MRKTELEALTVEKLRAMAKEMGLQGWSKMRKQELVEAILKAQSRKQPQEEKPLLAQEEKEAKRKGSEKGVAAERSKSPEVVEPSKGPKTTAGAPQVKDPYALRPEMLEDLGPLPQRYQVDRLRVVPRDPDWVFIQWEVSDRTWKEALAQHGGGKCAIEVLFDGVRALVSEADPWDGRYYARSPRPGSFVVAKLGLLDPKGNFHVLLESSPVKVPDMEKKQRPPQFMTLSPDAPLALREKASYEGRLLTEEEYRGLFGTPVPGSSKA